MMPRNADCDVLVIGGGFAGLAAARAAAEAGARVIVLEAKAEIGTRLHTTGIYVEEAYRADPPPPDLVRRVQQVRLYGPDGRIKDLTQSGYAFYTTDTGAVLQAMAKRARAAGAMITTGAPLKAGFQEGGKVEVLAGNKTYTGLCLIGADGARSAVADYFGLGRNRHFLAGVERHYDDHGRMDPAFLHVFLDPAMAPGYVGWAAATPHGAQVGLAVSQRRKPQIDRVLRVTQERFGLKAGEAGEWRAGLIPCGGMVKPWCDGVVALVGDAAGMVSPLTAGGIRTALVYGRMMGEAAGLWAQRKGPPISYALYGKMPRFGARHIWRWAMDRPPPSWALQALVNASPAGMVVKRMFFTRRG
jgi:digeranylgeranylglycerophospholipid reductase